MPVLSALSAASALVLGAQIPTQTAEVLAVAVIVLSLAGLGLTRLAAILRGRRAAKEHTGEHPAINAEVVASLVGSLSANAEWRGEVVALLNGITDKTTTLITEMRDTRHRLLNPTFEGVRSLVGALDGAEHEWGGLRREVHSLYDRRQQPKRT